MGGGERGMGFTSYTLAAEYAETQRPRCRLREVCETPLCIVSRNGAIVGNMIAAWFKKGTRRREPGEGERDWAWAGQARPRRRWF